MKTWTIKGYSGKPRPDLAMVKAESKEDALEALRKTLQDDDKYWTYIVKNDAIYQYAPGYGYKGEKWNPKDLRSEMWEDDMMGEVYDVVEFLHSNSD